MLGFLGSFNRFCQISWAATCEEQRPRQWKPIPRETPLGQQLPRAGKPRGVAGIPCGMRGLATAAQLLLPIIPAAGTLWELLALLPISPLAFDGLQKSLCGTRMLLGCFCPKLLCCVSQKLHGSGEKSLRREERALGSSSVLV